MRVAGGGAMTVRHADLEPRACAGDMRTASRRHACAGSRACTRRIDAGAAAPATTTGPGAYAGHTLVELLIAMAIGLLILSGALAMYRAQHAAAERLADAARVAEAGPLALALIRAC